MSEIACNVKNCHYWGQGNVCQADKIQVSNIDYSTDMEAGSFNQPAPSSNSHETQCVSFKPKK
ncbi:DUF1540 domain-containing protein [Halanaerobaculum tunisiense]